MKTLEWRRKTTKVIKLQWIASIWRQNYQKCWVTSQNIRNNAKLQNWSNYNELHRFDVKTIKNVELRRKTFKTTQNNESDQIIMYCIDLTSKRSKLVELGRKTFKTTQNYVMIKLQWIASIWRSKRSKQRKTTNKRDQITINLHRFDVKGSKRL